MFTLSVSSVDSTCVAPLTQSARTLLDYEIAIHALEVVHDGRRLSDDEEDVLRALRHMAQIEACYRVPPHFKVAARHLLQEGLAREVPWHGPCPPECGTALELLPNGSALAAQLSEVDTDEAFYMLRQAVGRRKSQGSADPVVIRRYDAPSI